MRSGPGSKLQANLLFYSVNFHQNLRSGIGGLFQTQTRPESRVPAALLSCRSSHPSAPTPSLIRSEAISLMICDPGPEPGAAERGSSDCEPSRRHIVSCCFKHEGSEGLSTLSAPESTSLRPTRRYRKHWLLLLLPLKRRRLV